MPNKTLTLNSKREISWISKIHEFLNILSDLTKFRITFFVSITTFVGFILHSKSITTNFILPTLGVLVLACGASALNEYQERNLDAQMKRTKLRPLPAGKISASNALLLSFILILFGSIILFSNSFSVLLLGLFTLIWYNGIYTPLKQKTAFAIIPGSLVGALPPIIGWVASGGGILDIQILTLATFMFIWQIPHFWLLMLIYDNQYKEAGYPTLSNIFNFNQIVKITFSWIVFLVLSSYFFYFSNLSVSYFSNALLAIAGILTLYLSSKVLFDDNREVFKKSFLQINVYVLFVLIVISVENII
jgi:protoheme IX farnesyltransferase